MLRGKVPCVWGTGSKLSLSSRGREEGKLNLEVDWQVRTNLGRHQDHPSWFVYKTFGHIRPGLFSIISSSPSFPLESKPQRSPLATKACHSESLNISRPAWFHAPSPFSLLWAPLFPSLRIQKLGRFSSVIVSKAQAGCNEHRLPCEHAMPLRLRMDMHSADSSVYPDPTTDQLS